MMSAPDRQPPPGMWASTTQLRKAAAAAVRLRLPWQLDFRLDTALDPDGTHILGLVTVLTSDPRTGEQFDEPIARCAAMPQFLGLEPGLAFHLALDVRLADYAACDPMNFAKMDEDTVTSWRTFMTEIQRRPELFASTTRHTAGRTAVIARTGRSRSH
jgi:hypothetical protein